MFRCEFRLLLDPRKNQPTDNRVDVNLDAHEKFVRITRTNIMAVSAMKLLGSTCAPLEINGERDLFVPCSLTLSCAIFVDS